MKTFSPPTPDAVFAAKMDVLVKAYEPRLLAYAWRILADQDAAIDAVQETFMRIGRMGHEAYDRDVSARVEPWLYRVCRDASVEVLRKNGKPRSLNDDGGEADAGMSRTAAEILEAKEKVDLAARLLDSLPMRQREVIHLKFQCQMDYSQIVEITGMTFNNVAVVLHTGLKTLRQRIEDSLKKGGHCEI